MAGLFLGPSSNEVVMTSFQIALFIGCMAEPEKVVV
jgi:hypothetical protein